MASQAEEFRRSRPAGVRCRQTAYCAAQTRVGLIQFQEVVHQGVGGDSQKPCGRLTKSIFDSLRIRPSGWRSWRMRACASAGNRSRLILMAPNSTGFSSRSNEAPLHESSSRWRSRPTVQMNSIAVKILQRRSHVVLVQKRTVRIGQLVAGDTPDRQLRPVRS